MGDYKECREAATEQRCANRCLFVPGNPAVIGPCSLRPVALRLRLSTDLPFSDAQYDQKSVNNASQSFSEIIN